MAELFWYQRSGHFGVDSAFSFRSYGVLESCICPSRNRMMQGSPALRYSKLLSAKEFRG